MAFVKNIPSDASFYFEAELLVKFERGLVEFIHLNRHFLIAQLVKIIPEDDPDRLGRIPFIPMSSLDSYPIRKCAGLVVGIMRVDRPNQFGLQVFNAPAKCIIFWLGSGLFGCPFLLPGFLPGEWNPVT